MSNEQSAQRSVRAGDHIFHKPSGEKWLVAAVSPEGKRLVCAGWPETIADIADCEVIKYSDEANYEKMLEDCRVLDDTRGLWTREVFRVRREHGERQAAKVLTFETLRKANLARMELRTFGHTLEGCPVGRWGLALGGATGDVLKVAGQIWQGNGTVPELASALADVVIYADLLSARLGFESARPHPHEKQDIHDFAELAKAYCCLGRPTYSNDIPPEHIDACLDLLYATMEAASDPSKVAHEPFVLMSAQRVADVYGIDLALAVVRKFNETSDSKKCPVKITEDGVVSQ